MINAIVDISHHNTVTSFEKVKGAGVFGIIHKATQGTTYKDPMFTGNRTAAVNAGLKVGAYHFGVSGDAIAQADHLIETAGADSLLVLDFEGNPQGADMSLEEAEQFVHRVFTATGKYPGLYSGHTVKEALQGAGITSPEQTELSKCWLWIARYGAAPSIPAIWPAWTLWQYTDGAAGPEPHSVDGIGPCDRDQFNGTLDELAAFWQSNGV